MSKLTSFCKTVARFPLHYQILIALIAGTIVGVIVNPGAIRLDDVQLVIERQDDAFVVTSQKTDGGPVETQSFDSEASLRQRYPQLAREFLKRQENGPLIVTITDRRLRFTEDDEAIGVSYTRKHDGKNVVTSNKVASREQLAVKLPHWLDLYDEHGGGLPARMTAAAKFLGDLFLRLLRMITVPLIVTSLVTGVAGLGSTARFGSMFGKTLLYYLATSLLAITTGLVMVNLVRPGMGAELPGGGGDSPVVGEEESLLGVFVGLVENMVPPNPVSSLANADFLSIITFSILLGIFIIYTGGESAETLRRFFQSGFEVMMRMTLAIISLAPIGVFAFMLFATATQGFEIFKTLAWYMLAVFLALVVHAVVVLPLLLKYVARRSPLEYAEAMSPALMTAFSTASSNGTLPLTITSVEQRAGVPNRISSFVLPLGATVNMDGTALYEAVAVLFIAQATPGVELTLGSQVVVAITALLASVGAAGIPHAGLVMMAIVLQAVGLPLEAQGIIIAVDRVLDMCRTSVNVWSDSCGCAVLARFERNDFEPGDTD